MNKKLFIGSTIIAGSLFTTIQASANTINVQATQKQELTQVISQDQIANTKVQDIQLQSSTNSINDNQELTVLNQNNVVPIAFDAKNTSLFPNCKPRSKPFNATDYPLQMGAGAIAGGIGGAYAGAANYVSGHHRGIY